MNGGMAMRVASLRAASGAARERALRLAAQADAMRWEGVAAAAFRIRLAGDVTELLRLAAAAERVADTLAPHIGVTALRRMVAR